MLDALVEENTVIYQSFVSGDPISPRSPWSSVLFSRFELFVHLNSRVLEGSRALEKLSHPSKSFIKSTNSPGRWCRR